MYQAGRDLVGLAEALPTWCLGGAPGPVVQALAISDGDRGRGVASVAPTPARAPAPVVDVARDAQAPGEEGRALSKPPGKGPRWAQGSAKEHKEGVPGRSLPGEKTSFGELSIAPTNSCASKNPRPRGAGAEISLRRGYPVVSPETSGTLTLLEHMANMGGGPLMKNTSTSTDQWVPLLPILDPRIKKNSGENKRPAEEKQCSRNAAVVREYYYFF